MLLELPRVGVLITSYNAEGFIWDTLLSVDWQTYPNIEVVVVDDSSDDGTQRLLSFFQGQCVYDVTTFFHEKNQGAYKTLNHGLRELYDRGVDYVAILDHDDLWHRRKIERQVSEIQSCEWAKAVGSYSWNWYERYDMCRLKKRPLRSWGAIHSSFMMENNGVFYPEGVHHADREMMEERLCKGEELVKNIDEPLVLKRYWDSERNLSFEWNNESDLYDVYTRFGLYKALGCARQKYVPRRFNELFELVVNETRSLSSLPFYVGAVTPSDDERFEGFERASFL